MTCILIPLSLSKTAGEVPVKRRILFDSKPLGIFLGLQRNILRRNQDQIKFEGLIAATGFQLFHLLITLR